MEDHSGSANLVLFDKEASSLVGKPCAEMVEASEKVVMMSYCNMKFPDVIFGTNILGILLLIG